MSSVVETVKRLLALSKSDNEHEAAAALGRAQAIAQKHRIQIDELGLDLIRKSTAEIFEHEPVLTGNKVPRWKIHLLSVVANANGCKLVVFGKEFDERHYILIGRQEDAELVRHMYHYASISIAKAATRASRGKGVKYRNQWLIGAVEGIRLQLTKETFGAGLVLIDKRKADADATMHHAFRVKKNVTRATVSNHAAYREGKIAGKELNLG